MYNYNKLPEHIRGATQRYIERGILPGDFLQAVICNDLKESFARADEENIAKMFDIVSFFYNEVPRLCWGSKERMKTWMANKEAEELDAHSLRASSLFGVPLDKVTADMRQAAKIAALNETYARKEAQSNGT